MAGFLRTSMKAAVAVAAISAALALKVHHASRSADSVQTRPKRTVEITYSFSVCDIPERAQRMRIWVPVPPSNSHQQLHDMILGGDWTYRIVDDPQFGNRFLIIDVNNVRPSGSREAAFCVKFRVTRHAIQTLREHPSAPPAAQDEPARYLAANRLIPIDGRIAAEAQRIAGHLRHPLNQARILYDNIVATIHYDKSGTGWGRGDALYACDLRKGNCTDFHSLFIAQARALGIPARFIMGLPLAEDENQGVIAGYHCWGEFYLPDRGWCPIDASEAGKFPQKKDQLFCGLDEHRVAFTTGRDIKLPGSTAEPMNYVIYPYVEIDGRAHDDVQTTFFFKNYPADTSSQVL